MIGKTKTPKDSTMTAKANSTVAPSVVIKAPNLQTARFHIEGTAPFVQLAFGQKAKGMLEGMMEGKSAKSKKVRDARNIEREFENALHRSKEGWIGIPAAAFRAAMVSACRLVNFKMTLAKMSVFVKHDGIDRNDGQPLIKLKGEPVAKDSRVINANGSVDIRIRGFFEEWSAIVNVTFDADQFSLQDVTNLMHRAGAQVGVGEGRPDSKRSTGMGWGTFAIAKVEA